MATNTAPPGSGIGSMFTNMVNQTAQQQVPATVQDLITQLSAPQLGGINQQLAAGMFGAGGLAWNQANQDYQTGVLNQNFGLQNQLLGLQGDELGIQRGALGRQQALLPMEEQLANQMFGLQGEPYSQAQQAHALQLLQGSQAARGSNIGQEAGWQQANLNRQYERQREMLGVEKQRSDLSFKEQAAQLGDQSARLDIASKRLGINREQLSNSLSQALDQLHLSGMLTEQQLTDSIYNTMNGLPDALGGVGLQVLNMLGLTPGIMSQNPNPDTTSPAGITPIASAPVTQQASGGGGAGLRQL